MIKLLGYGAPNTPHDFFVYDQVGKVWNGSAYVLWSDPSFVSYRVAGSEMGTGGRFFSLDTPAGAVYWDLRPRADTLSAAVDSGTLLQPGVLATGSVASTTGTTTTLDTEAAATASYYINAKLVIIGGTGSGQERLVTAYSAGRVATHAAWTTNPTSTSTFAITSDSAEVAAIKVKTDFLPSATAGAASGLAIVGSAMTLSAAAVQAIWDALTAALTTVGSVGKKLADWVIGTTQTGDSFARLGAPVGASLSADVAAIPTVIRLKKNIAFSNFSIVMLDASGDPATGKTVAGTVSIDGAAFAALTNAVSENASGAYKVNLAAADMNGNDVLLKFTAAGCRTLFLKIVMQA